MNGILHLTGLEDQWEPFTTNMLESVKGYDGGYATVPTEMEAEGLAFMHEKMAQSQRDVDELLMNRAKIASFTGLSKEI